MEKFLNKIKQFFLIRKLKNMSDKLKKNTSTKISGKNTFVAYSSGESATFNSKEKQIIEKVIENVTAIVKKTNADPEKLLEYIKAANTPVYIVKNCTKLLKNIHEEEGLICEQKGISALFLSILTGQGLKFRTQVMFVLSKTDVDKFIFLHSFYRWYSLKSGLDGFDCDTQYKLKKYKKNNSPQATRTLSLNDVIRLKSAIARDQEATRFVLDYINQVDVSKKVLERIKKGERTDI